MYAKLETNEQQMKVFKNYTANASSQNRNEMTKKNTKIRNGQIHKTIVKGGIVMYLNNSLSNVCVYACRVNG